MEKKRMKQTAFRFTDETLARIDEMSHLCGLNRTQWLVSVINREYDSLHGNPELKQFFEQLQQISMNFAELNVPYVPKDDGKQA